MASRSARRRPAHTAHGALYWSLFMWPVALGGALSRMRGRGRRSMPRSRHAHTALRIPAPPALPGKKPPPPPSPDGVVWRGHEGEVRPQWRVRKRDGSGSEKC